MTPLLSSDEEWNSSEELETFLRETIRVERLTPKEVTRDKLNHLGLTLALISGLSYAVASFIVKEVPWATAAELTFVRYAGAVAFSSPIFVVVGAQSGSVDGNLREYDQRLALLTGVRGLAAALNIFFRFGSFKRLPLANANLIAFSSPAFVALLARIFLKEKCSLTLTCSLVLNSVGLALVVTYLGDDSSSSQFQQSGETLGVIYGFLSLSLDTFSYVLGRYMKEYDPATVQFHVAWNALISSIILTLTLDFNSKDNSRTFSQFDRDCYVKGALILSLALTSFAGTGALMRAFQLEEAGPVSVVRASSEIAAIFVFQVIFQGLKPEISTVIGSFLVISAGAILNLRKIHHAKCKFIKNK